MHMIIFNFMNWDAYSNFLLFNYTELNMIFHHKYNNLDFVENI
jgi:hypothetical protein